MTKRPFIGVATTTQIALVIGGEPWLEPMNILADDGCGVPTTAPASIGAKIAIAFRLSSSKRTIRCKAEVVAETATTPAGMKLRQTHGDEALDDAMSLGDSATSIVRLDAVAKVKAKAKPQAKSTKSTGLCLRFLDLSPPDLALVRAHIAHSREIETRLAIGNESTSADRKIGLAFDDPKLSDKANDW